MSKIKFLIPDLLTGVNICIGFVCIILVIQAAHLRGIFHNNYILAAWLIVVAAIIDAFDGAIARWFGKGGSFGIEFDSLSDVTVFAIAPTVLLYTCFYQGYSAFWLLLPLLYLVAAAYRLARYNIIVLQTTEKKLLGVTVPMSTLIIVAVFLIIAKLHQHGIIQGISWGSMAIISGFIVINSILMVSKIEFIKLDEYCFLDKKRMVIPLVAIFGPLFLLRFKFPAASVLMLALFYVVESLGRSLLWKKSDNKIENKS